jgi:hypothetical protein
MMLHDVPVFAIQVGFTVQIDHRCAVSFGPHGPDQQEQNSAPGTQILDDET